MAKDQAARAKKVRRRLGSIAKEEASSNLLGKLVPCLCYKHIPSISVST